MTELAAIVAVTAGLLAMNGLFVAAEFALMGARPTLLQPMAESGQRFARPVLRLLHDPGLQDPFFATMQLGITLASLGLGMYGEHKLVELVAPGLLYLGAWVEPMVEVIAWVLAVSVLTYLHVVLGEMVPKTAAMRYPETVILRLYRPMRLSQLAFSPLVWLLNGMGNTVLRLLRVPLPTGAERILSPEELEMVIEDSAEGGLIPANESQILIRIMDFSDRSVHQVMTPRTRVDAVPLAISEPELAARLVASRHTRLPVYDQDIDHIVGVLHIKDYVRWRLRREEPFDLRSMAHPVPMVPELMPVEEMLETFRRQRRHLAIVLDEYGGTAGLVSLEDVVEEVVGEVRDEFDVESAPVERLTDGSLDVRGDVILEDLAELVDLPDERPEVATVAGLVMTLLGRPAGVGDTVQLGAIHIEVREVDGRAVRRVRVVQR